MVNKTCVTLTESSPRKLNSILKKTLRRSDYVELRFDFMSPTKIPIALNLVKKELNRCICTLRPRSEGGKFSGNEKNRISILKLLAVYNPFLLDVEYNTIKNNRGLFQYLKESKTNLLLSWHDFKKTSSVPVLKQMLKKMTRYSKYIKIVTTARSIGDTVKVLSLYKDLPKSTSLVAFAMGDYGRMSRILCTQMGSPYTYVTLGKPIAPGQYSLDEVKSLFKLKK